MLATVGLTAAPRPAHAIGTGVAVGILLGGLALGATANPYYNPYYSRTVPTNPDLLAAGCGLLSACVVLAAAKLLGPV